jgi:guanyl-specific ribonuclease Sa
MLCVAHSVAMKWQTMGIGLQKILRHSVAHFKLKFSYSDMWSIFKNREGFLPKQSENYYQEFVHPTPGVTGAGPQRIIRGQNGDSFYTPDHYQTFIQVE